MKKKWYLSIAALSLFLTFQKGAARAAIIINDENINEYQYNLSPAETEEILKERLMSQLNEAKQEFDKLGIAGLHQVLIEQLPRVEIKKSECESGTVFRWMFFKNNEVRAEKNVIWEGKGPLVGYEFSIENDRKLYKFFVPSFGENIALKEIAIIVMVPGPTVYESQAVVKYVDKPVEVVKYVDKPVLVVKEVLKEVVKEVKKFPWPPPIPSASAKIPSEFLFNRGTTTLLKDVAKKLETAFNETDYSDISYHLAPDGFALISKLEHFNPDGTPKNPDRWSDKGSIRDLSSYIEALFKANPGYYRVIAFVVTRKTFTPDGVASRDDASGWLNSGTSVLPPEIGKQSYTADHYCKALIYEFEKPAQGQAFFRSESDLSGKDHLEKSNLWSILKK